MSSAEEVDAGSGRMKPWAEKGRVAAALALLLLLSLVSGPAARADEPVQPPAQAQEQPPTAQAQEQPLAQAGTARRAPAGPSLQISLLTMSPGDELFTAFGHTAIRVRALDGPRLDITYDYGTYNASDPDAPLKFMQGKLPYWLSVGPTTDVVSWYGRAFSGITEQVLELQPEQAQMLAARLADNARPEKREYAYHHFRDNCATRPRDLLDEALGGALQRATIQAPSGATYRLLIDRSMSWAPYFRWPVYGLLNGLIDLPISRWEQMFLPAYLRDELQELRVERDGAGPLPVVRARRIIVGEDRPARQPDPTPWVGLVVCLGLAALCATPALLLRLPRLARVAQGLGLALWGLAAGGYGTLLAVAWAISPYPETKDNGNMLIFHPLLLLLVPAGLLVVAGKRIGRRLGEPLLLVALLGLLLAALLDLSGATPQQLFGFSLAGASVTIPSWLGLRRVGRG